MPPRPSSEMISKGPSVRPSRLMSVIDVTSLRAIRQRRSGNDSAVQKVPGFPNLNVALSILSHRPALVNRTHDRNMSKKNEDFAWGGLDGRCPCVLVKTPRKPGFDITRRV